MKTLSTIEEKTVTLQQEKGFNDYAKMVNETEVAVSEHRFQEFYSVWCAERGLFNDIEQSNF